MLQPASFWVSGVAKAARVARLCDQARGGPRADAIDRGKEFSNFVRLKLGLDGISIELGFVSSTRTVRRRGRSMRGSPERLSPTDR
jgi:hypothetical protein